MTNSEKRYLIHLALSVLSHHSPGHTERVLVSRIEAEMNAPLTTIDSKLLLKELERLELVYTYQDPITDEIIYAITEGGLIHYATS